MLNGLQVESYFSDIGGTLGLFLGMSLMSIVEFIELFMDLIIFAIIHCRISMRARRRLAAQQMNGEAPTGSNNGPRMPWEAPPNGFEAFDYRNRGPPPSYRAATRMSRAYPNEVRDVLLNM